jgi:hypothetical protein
MATQEDKFAGHPAGLDGPGNDWVTITPHDSNPLPFLPKAICAGGTGGAVVCVSRAGNESTFHLAAGQRLNIRPHIIKAAGTVATPIIALKE